MNTRALRGVVFYQPRFNQKGFFKPQPHRNRMENSKTAVAVYREKPHNFLIYLNFTLGLLSMENSMNVFVLASILLHA
jgi:hypothetical protein